MHCAAPGRSRFTGLAVEIDTAKRIFTTLPVVPVDRGGGGSEAALDFAHFANGDGVTSEMVFVNMKTQPSGPAPTPFHVAIPPIRPAIYFYDTEGALVGPESLVEVTGDLEITEDGGLTVRTQMEPLGVLTISTHGQGPLVTGSVRVVSDAPLGGMLRYDLPHVGEAVVGASPPVRDALFPVRRLEGGITTGVALHNLESSAGLVRCELRQEGVLLDAATIPLEANGQTSWLIDKVSHSVPTSGSQGASPPAPPSPIRQARTPGHRPQPMLVMGHHQAQGSRQMELLLPLCGSGYLQPLRGGLDGGHPGELTPGQGFDRPELLQAGDRVGRSHPPC